MNGELDSWAIRWHYAVFVHDGLTLFPPRTLVSNTGFDGSGTHGRLALPSREARLDASGSYRLPDAVVASPDTDLVYQAIAAAHESSVYAKMVAMLRYAIRHRPGGR